eukprot:764668-Hanusia_phi.AAC.2
MTGILADGFANVKRAVQNNFADVYKQRIEQQYLSVDSEHSRRIQEFVTVDIHSKAEIVSGIHFKAEIVSGSLQSYDLS